MSKRYRESKRGKSALNASLQSLEEEIEKISLTLDGSKQQKPPISARWGDTDEDTIIHRKTTIEPVVVESGIPSGDDCDSELQLSDAASRAGSSTAAPEVKRLKLRDGPTPEFFGDFSWDVLSSPNGSDYLSFFKWARDEQPPSTTSPPKDKVNDEIDPGDTGGAIPAEKPKVGRSATGTNIFRPIKENRVQSTHSSDSSDMFLEQDSDAVTERMANQGEGDTDSIEISFAKSQSFDPIVSKSQSFQLNCESGGEQGVNDDAPIVIPIATLVEDTKLDGGEKPFYERRKFWVFILCQFIIVAIVVAMVLVVRDGDDDNGERSVEGVPTSAPVPISVDQEFTDIPTSFLDSYSSTLAWFGVETLDVGNPNLQRFVLGWLWYQTTNNGADPWISCNPPNAGDSMQCEFLDDITSLDDANFCFASKASVNRWLSSANECSWGGISCDLNGRVTGISLPGIGLKGNFPFFIDRLTQLKELNFSFGGLEGTLPQGIKALSQLQKLDLSHNLLVDPIPDPLFSLPLTSLQLNANRFRGPIPLSFGSFSKISVLDLSANEFSGTLPDELGLVVSLEKLALGDNSLTGANLPSSWGNLVNMRDLRLQRTGLDGIIPQEFASLTKLERLDLKSNNLVGSLPPMPWPLLLSFEVQGNSLEGSFPLEIL
eukprot:scaffold703_cov168-Amphora_coffeaeformis.AAC.13